MLTYRDVETFLSAGLQRLGYSDANPYTPGGPVKSMPVINPGPFSLPTLQKIGPQAIVFATVGNGAGMVLEQLFDQVFITIRVIGRQNDYDGTEALAYDIDRLLLALNGNGTIGSTPVLYVVRTGGAPQLTDRDASDRYSFQTTYITPAATGM